MISKKNIRAFRQYIPFLAIAGIFLWALISTSMHRIEESPPGTITIRIAHWQLEPGVQTAIDRMAEKYRKIHPNVRIIQEAIPETSYGQWVSTQLMGGTGPDLLEMGKDVLPYHVWVSYYNRYMIPLTQYVQKPNPYNKDNELAHTPLRNTFKDGMKIAYIIELQEYMNIPLTQLSFRIFYNKTLLKKLTGLDKAPEDYRKFLEVCKQIQLKTDGNGDAYIPIAASRFHIVIWNMKLFHPLSYSALRYADFNRDGYVGNDEHYVAFKTGMLDMRSPMYKAIFTSTREVTDYFQPGFVGLTRDEAVFTFAQEKSVFIATGTWDARGLMSQAEGVFEIGVMNFPWPSKDDPEFGKFAEGPVYDRPFTAVGFAVNRTGKNPKTAMDFLMFMASKENNEEFNKIAGWTPCIIGAESPDYLKAFKPILKGVYSSLNFNLGGESWIKWLQTESLYLGNQITYDELVDQFQPFYIEKGYKDYLEQNKDWTRGMNVNEQLLCVMRVNAMLSPEKEKASRWVKYRALSTSLQVWPEIDRKKLGRMIADGSKNQTGPYIYSDKLINKIRKRLQNKKSRKNNT